MLKENTPSKPRVENIAPPQRRVSLDQVSMQAMAWTCVLKSPLC